MTKLKSETVNVAKDIEMHENESDVTDHLESKPLTSKPLTQVDQLNWRRDNQGWSLLCILFYNPIDVMIKLALSGWSI